MNFWGSEECSPTAKSNNSSSRSSALDMLTLPTASEAGAFYHKLNRDIDVLRKKVDQKLKDMMAASDTDLNVLNSALGEFKIDESIADQLINRFPSAGKALNKAIAPETSLISQLQQKQQENRQKSGSAADPLTREELDDKIVPPADSNITERAANLSNRGVPKKAESKDAELIGIIKFDPVQEEGEEDEEDDEEEEKEDQDSNYRTETPCSFRQKERTKKQNITSFPEVRTHNKKKKGKGRTAPAQLKDEPGYSGIRQPSQKTSSVKKQEHRGDSLAASMTAPQGSDSLTNGDIPAAKYDKTQPPSRSQRVKIKEETRVFPKIVSDFPNSYSQVYEEHPIIVLHDDEEEEQQIIFDMLGHEELGDFSYYGYHGEEQEKLIEIISVEDYESTGEYVRQQIPMSVIEESEENDQEEDEEEDDDEDAEHDDEAEQEDGDEQGEEDEENPNLSSDEAICSDANSCSPPTQNQSGKKDERIHPEYKRNKKDQHIGRQRAVVDDNSKEQKDPMEEIQVSSSMSTEGDMARPDPSPRGPAVNSPDKSKETEKEARVRREPSGTLVGTKKGDDATDDNAIPGWRSKTKQPMNHLKKAPFPEADINAYSRRGRSKKTTDTASDEGLDSSDNEEETEKPKQRSRKNRKDSLVKSLEALKKQLDSHTSTRSGKGDRRPSPERPRRLATDHRSKKNNSRKNSAEEDEYKSHQTQNSGEDSYDSQKYLPSNIQEKRELAAKRYKLPICINDPSESSKNQSSSAKSRTGSDPRGDSDSDHSSGFFQTNDRSFSNRGKSLVPIISVEGQESDYVDEGSSEESNAFQEKRRLSHSEGPVESLTPWTGSQNELTSSEKQKGIRAAEHVLATLNTNKSKSANSFENPIAAVIYDHNESDILKGDDHRHYRKSARDSRSHLRRRELPRRRAPPVDELAFHAEGDSDSTEELDMDGVSHQVEKLRRKSQNRSTTIAKRRNKSSKPDTQRKQSERKKKIDGRRNRDNHHKMKSDIEVHWESSDEGATSSPHSDEKMEHSKTVEDTLPLELSTLEISTMPQDDHHTLTSLDKQRKHSSRATAAEKRYAPQTSIVRASSMNNEAMENLSPLSTTDEFGSKPFQDKKSGALEGTDIGGDKNLILLQQVQNKIISDPYGDEGRYSGVMVGGRPHGQGTLHYKDGRVYSGDWRHGRWHGYGHAVFTNGDAYIGQYDNDKRHGHGRYEWSDGRVYDGGFQNDLRQGEGTYTWPDGAVYTGDFFKGLRHGKGRYIFPDGSVYNGDWQNGKYHGLGECIWVDGRRYKGEWRHGQAQGYGVEHRPDGSIRHEGEWKNDRPVRQRRGSATTGGPGDNNSKNSNHHQQQQRQQPQRR